MRDPLGKRDRPAGRLALAQAGDREVDREHHRLVAVLSRAREDPGGLVAVLAGVELEPQPRPGRRRGDLGQVGGGPRRQAEHRPGAPRRRGRRRARRRGAAAAGPPPARAGPASAAGRPSSSIAGSASAQPVEHPRAQVPPAPRPLVGRQRELVGGASGEVAERRRVEALAGLASRRRMTFIAGAMLEP